jgi:hypothetical protein
MASNSLWTRLFLLSNHDRGCLRRRNAQKAVRRIRVRIACLMPVPTAIVYSQPADTGTGVNVNTQLVYAVNHLKVRCCSRSSVPLCQTMSSRPQTLCVCKTSQSSPTLLLIPIASFSRSSGHTTVYIGIPKPTYTRTRCCLLLCGTCWPSTDVPLARI